MTVPRTPPSPLAGEGVAARGEGKQEVATMNRPETPFPKHWRYYIVLKWAVVAAAVLIAFGLLGAF
jgi:hypothetical protein